MRAKGWGEKRGGRESGGSSRVAQEGLEHLDRSKRPHRSNRRQKIDLKCLGKSTQTLRKLFGPRKRKCVDFITQIQRKR